MICPSFFIISVFPSSYFFPKAETSSVNESSATGNCSNVTSMVTDGPLRCDTPTSSVLFDGNIPTLTGLDEDMWASQLLTVQTTNQIRREILSDFTGTPGYVGVGRVELAMFNCPKWGIGVQVIGLSTAPSLEMARLGVRIFTVPNITSCDSLVRICISQTIEQPVIGLEFTSPPGSTWTHLAEVTFYNVPTCLPDTAPPLSAADSTASTQQDSTTSEMLASTASPQLDPTTSEMLASNSNTKMTTTSMPSSSSTIIIIPASIGCVVLLIVCLLAAVLILWRCYYVKHHKHNTSHHPAVGHSHPPPVTLCDIRVLEFNTCTQHFKFNVHHNIIISKDSLNSTP